MIRWLLVLPVLMLTTSASALIMANFASVDAQAGAPVLLIVTVPADAEQPLEGRDGVLDYEVQVGRILRAPEESPARKEGLVGVSTVVRLRPGRTYLMATLDGGSRDGKPWLVFNSDDGVTEIPASLDWRTLVKDKTPEEIVKAVIVASHKALGEEIKTLEAERARLAKLLPVDTRPRLRDKP